MDRAFNLEDDARTTSERGAADEKGAARRPTGNKSTSVEGRGASLRRRDRRDRVREGKIKSTREAWTGQEGEERERERES